MQDVAGIIFDKDGTLFSFGDTWNGWAERFLEVLSGGEEQLRSRAAEAIGFDLVRKSFQSDSFAIAGTVDEIGEALASIVGWSVAEIVQLGDRLAVETPQAKVPGMENCLAELADRYSLALMTNDTEFAARAHLEGAEVDQHFDMIVGYDSGFGAKPAPDPLLAIASKLGVAASECLMVGDSLHDLKSGRAAGMGTIGVLTGMATAEDLADWANVILPDITHLPNWIATQ